MILGYNYESLGMDRFDNHPLDLGELNDIHNFNPTETDNYFTPNLFKGNHYSSDLGSRRSQNNLCWLQSFYVDIDGIEGVTDPDEALKQIKKDCEAAGIPYPDITLHTSTNPTVHLQLFWLHDPLWVYDNREDTIDNMLYMSWWKDTAIALSEVLASVNDDLNIDKAKSRDPSAYMRLPGGYNQKTNQGVMVLDAENRDKRFTLEDDWLTNLRKRFYSLHKDTKFKVNPKRDIELLAHPHIQKLLEGVPEGYRNYSQYAISKACQYDGLTVKEAIELILKQNKRCDDPERVSKVKGVVRSSYRNKELGISSQIVADTINGAFGLDVEPDPALFMATNDEISVSSYQSKGKYLSKQETYTRVIRTVLELVKEGRAVLPGVKELAKLAGVKYDTLKKEWKQIIKILQEGFSLKLRNACHYHSKYIILNKAEELLTDSFSSLIDLKQLKVILSSLKAIFADDNALNIMINDLIKDKFEVSEAANSPP